MRHFPAGLVVLLSLSALAQDVPDLELEVPGARVQVRERRHHRTLEPAPVMPPPAVFGAQNFTIDYQPLGGAPAGAIKVVSPEGATAQVWNEDGSLAGEFSVPFVFSARAGAFYRFILFAPDGQLLLDRKYEVKQFVGGTLRLRGAAVQVQVSAPPPQVAGCPEADFAALLSAIDEASFSEDKLGVVATAAQSNVFTVEQVGRLVDAMSFSGDKLKVVELLRGRLVDRQSAFKLLEHFTFSGDKQKAQALLR